MLLIHWSKALNNKILQEQGVHGCCSVANRLLLFKVGLQTAIQSLSHVQLFATQHYGLQHARLSCSSLFPSSNRHAQIHVHWVGNATQPSHPLSPPSPLAFKLSQHQGLFQSVSSLHQMAKVLEHQLQHQSFQCIFRIDFLQNWLVWSLCSPTNFQESSPAPQFEGINSWGTVNLGWPCMAWLIASLSYCKPLCHNKAVIHEGVCTWMLFAKRRNWAPREGGNLLGSRTFYDKRSASGREFLHTDFTPRIQRPRMCFLLLSATKRTK